MTERFPPLSRILYVDDEPDIREVAKIALEVMGGFTVRACESGMSALAEAPSFKPDLILLDVMMPHMDGPETFEALRQFEALKTVPIVFFTAKAQRSEVQALLELGALDVLAKPFDPMTVAQTVSEIWMRHHGWDS
ncbi:response regulator [Aliidongia dinghuensis]|uniref:Response regulator n=1 Tax=Aliidongia dinghuensis TaxID=1867774 RepID=A0A8J3E5J6_9PROT|nr:response regulator [Aliidongia dinghuensis]GGF36291.1 response regulator [Aliidongia dinghuensis]